MGRLPRDIGSEDEEANADELERAALTLFILHVVLETPEQHGARETLDHRVRAEADEGDAPREQTGPDGDRGFDHIPAEGEEFEPTPRARIRRPFEGVGAGIGGAAITHGKARPYSRSASPPCASRIDISTSLPNRSG